MDNFKSIFEELNNIYYNKNNIYLLERFLEENFVSVIDKAKACVKYDDYAYKLSRLTLDISKYFLQQKKYNIFLKFCKISAMLNNKDALLMIASYYENKINKKRKYVNNALKYYLKSYRLGCYSAYLNIGNIYFNYLNKKDGIKYYKELVINRYKNGSLIYAKTYCNIINKIIDYYLNKSNNEHHFILNIFLTNPIVTEIIETYKDLDILLKIGFLFSYNKDFGINNKEAQKYYNIIAKEYNLNSEQEFYPILDYLYKYKKQSMLNKQDFLREIASVYYFGLNYDIEKYQNYSKALELYKTAAHYGDKTSAIQASNMYQFGIGCNKNLEEAINFCKIAIKNGSLKTEKILYNLEKQSNIQYTTEPTIHDNSKVENSYPILPTNAKELQLRVCNFNCNLEKLFSNIKQLDIKNDLWAIIYANKDFENLFRTLSVKKNKSLTYTK